MIVNSPLQQFKRKFQTPKTETYDLVKVKIDNSTHMHTNIITFFDFQLCFSLLHTCAFRFLI